MEHDLTTEEGLVAYMSESQDEADWGRRCDEVKRVNGGYPDFWFRTIIMSGLMNRTLGAGASDLKIVALKYD